jgi:hypothetical protein
MIQISMSFLVLIGKIIATTILGLIGFGLSYGSWIWRNDPEVQGHGWPNILLSLAADWLIGCVIVFVIWNTPIPQLFELVP